MKRIAVVGCGAAGGTAAQFARKAARDAEIVIYDGEGYGQYSKCALPYVVRGMLEAESIVEFSPEWFRKQRIDYRNERVNVDLEARVIEGREESFDAIIVATGAMPASPFPAEGAYFLRSMEDALKIRKKALEAKDAIIIGAGLIGMELAESFHEMGLRVRVLEYMPFILPAMLDADMASMVRKSIDVEIKTSCRVEGVEGKAVVADEEYRADIVVVAAGNVPVVLERKEAIKVNLKCETGIEGVYAAGDCTSMEDFFGRRINVGLGSIATRQGRVAGINAAGGNEEMLPPVMPRTTKIFGMEIASVGLLEREAEGAITAKYAGKDLPHYMEGERIIIKMVADEEGKILGCQAVGKGAAKIIDRVAVAIYKGMDIKEMARMENAYAPVVAPTFDALSIVCGMIERKLK